MPRVLEQKSSDTTFSTISPVEKHEMSNMDVTTVEDGNGDMINESYQRKRLPTTEANVSGETVTTGTIEPITVKKSLSTDRVPLFEPYINNLPTRFLLDCIPVCLFGAIILSLALFCWPYHRGFNCDDDSIRYPYKGDTVTPLMLGLYPTILLVVLISLNEYNVLRIHFESQKKLTKTHWKLYFWQLYFQAIPLAFAVVGSQLITHISKYTIGRLRPHFIDLCNPKIKSTGEIITRFSNCSYPQVYIIDYECTGVEEHPYLVIDSHLSFMSGHSSHMAVSMVYLIIYLQARWHLKNGNLGKQAIQTILFSFAFWVALTRISDYKHHWSDVLFGFLQGTLFAIFTAVYGSNLFKSQQKPISKVHHQSLTSVSMRV